jgi:DnaJ-class molecular chaperone
MSKEKDLLLLGIVKANPTKQDLKTAYLHKAKVLHPDMQGGSHEKFLAVQTAYQRLITGVSPGKKTALKQVCPNCNGSGKRPAGSAGFAPIYLPCRKCCGRGKISIYS